MSFEDIVYLINLIDKSQISFMELNYEKVYLKLDKSTDRQFVEGKSGKVNNLVCKSVVEEITDEEDSNPSSINIEKVESFDDDSNFSYILSPMVGTVYLAPSPGKQTYVCEQQSINKGDVVCIVEAMKLMNEIESEYSGKIVEVLVKDSQMVEYGQKLFKVKCN